MNTDNLNLPWRVVENEAGLGASSRIIYAVLDSSGLWTAALRSGEFKQGKTHLCYKNTYCCLGVACEIACRQGVPITRNEDVTEIILFDDRQGQLPESVMEWLGIRTSGGEYRLGALYRDNDSYNKTFSEIADIIDSKPEGLFI